MATIEDAPLVTVVEGILNRVANHRGVLGLMVISPKDGSVWKTGTPNYPPNGGPPLDEAVMQQHASKLHAFVGLTRSIVRTLDVENELDFLRIRSKKHEFIISPAKEYVLIVIQDYHMKQEAAPPVAAKSPKKTSIQEGEAAGES
eukprot:TRINITY_DN28769_c0_g1_i1.p2 TRINITY_DN28769_c0_g1~~TRINITY_DN28769_c0_g1_i1.p2  ORF type:complete len:145 (+),score=71.23 TRINITY_DN28769_c0_g1_i1:84-518(+)